MLYQCLLYKPIGQISIIDISQKFGQCFSRLEFENFHRAYNELLFREVLADEDSIWRSLYFSNSELDNEYHELIPESFALGVAYAVTR